MRKLLSHRGARAVSALAVSALTSSGCGDDPAATTPPAPHPLCVARPELCAAPAAAAPTFTPPVTVAPSGALPPEVVSQDAHNNLDVAWHDGRLFFAFRTAPNHFADPATVMWIVSSPDLVTWRFEGQVAIGTDVREPQLLSLNGKLLFYFTELGDNPFDFTPHGTRVAEWLGPGQLAAPRPIFEDGFLAWRVKPMTRPGDDAGWVYAFGYGGGENIYDNDGEPIRVQWLRSRDGLAWEPVDRAHPVVLEGGASETDAVFLDDGSVVAVARNESGDATGFGSKICRAPARAIGAWECQHDPRKYDSPLVFRTGADVWLVARRNVTETGAYDLGHTDKAPKDQYVDYQSDYWVKPKRCSLWKVDPAALTVSFVLDLPSRGDTCFPEAVELAPKTQLVFNYTSPLDGSDDIDWVTGQTHPTLIYWTILTLP